MANRNRIAIVGAGHVGATTAYALMLRALFREIVLIDDNFELAQAEAADLSDADALARPCHVWAGTYSDAAAAQIAVITAGAASHGDESRLSLAARSMVIVDACTLALTSAGFKGVILVASNPVDLMALVAFRRAGLPAAQVIGTGTLLDSSRLQQALATHLNVAPQSVSAQVLGEHGDSEVATFSTARVGGMTLDQFAPDFAAAERVALSGDVREAGYAIIAGKGYTSFGVATAIVRICEAVIRDERAILPVSTLLTGQYGVDGLYLSLPCVLGAEGVERVLSPALSPDEEAGLRRSAATLSIALNDLDSQTS